jgi:hypothetical protein
MDLVNVRTAQKTKTAQKSKASSVPKPPELEIAKVGNELTEHFQLIENAWKKAEELLALSHIPIDVRIHVKADHLYHDVPGGEPEQCYADVMTFISYCKTRTGWKICWVQETDYAQHPDTQVEQKLISECSTETRLEMFEHFPALYAAVVKRVKEYMPKIREKVTSFEAVLGSLDKV